MPWQELSPVNLRMYFITDWQRDCWTMTELCADYQISRKTGYKWVDRFETAGPPGLHDASRRPAHSPSATEAALVDQLVALRTRHPRWGARKLLAVAARRDPTPTWPSRSTVCALLKARGLVAPRSRRSRHAHVASPLAPITAANQTWTTDFKGHFRTGDGIYCYPLTLRDGFSRFVLCCQAVGGPTYKATRPLFERAFGDYGLPEGIRSDNGGPFASTGLRRLSRLSVWWLRLGIQLERIALGHPEQNGSHEQFHAVLKANTARPPAANARAQQQRFVRFCAEYNDDRPHEALGDRVPASCYQPSPRSLPTRLPPLEYPAHWEIRRVSTIGQVTWGGQVFFLSGALAGEDVAFEEVDDGLWTVYFATLALGRYDLRHRRIQPIAPLTEGRSPAAPARA
jgi:transposase InsO family protein